ncbi:hypothetical protein RM530_08910 [Algiphilus sp. W345]|uniref:Transposase n=1 Tax=Banduia mediterranea TaxID=3075609 RepID=A0ABU2WHX7_9GAMM|nr:hypothetical protein [Algiphilus sp. W345]MDT0497480.1 hypothetical protein [Algiphilus sp. W345]
MISQISDMTWERINQHLLRQACADRVERSDRLRIDSTVTDAPIRAPSDRRCTSSTIRMFRG